MYTNSMTNLIMGGGRQPQPTVGMGATILHWTDRTACTIVHVSANGRFIKVQADKATRTDGHGMSDAQSYSYERDPSGALSDFSLRKNGKWIRVGDSMKGQRLSIGERCQYYDYSF
jgi:hypothetical protein